MTDFFYWTGDDGCTKPRWMADALADGIAWLENAGTPQVRLVIGGRSFDRCSAITAADVETARRRGLAL